MYTALGSEGVYFPQKMKVFYQSSFVFVYVRVRELGIYCYHTLMYIPHGNNCQGKLLAIKYTHGETLPLGSLRASKDRVCIDQLLS